MLAVLCNAGHSSSAWKLLFYCQIKDFQPHTAHTRRRDPLGSTWVQNKDWHNYAPKNSNIFKNQNYQTTCTDQLECRTGPGICSWLILLPVHPRDNQFYAQGAISPQCFT